MISETHQQAKELYIAMCYAWQYKHGELVFSDLVRLHELYEKALTEKNKRRVK